VRTKEIRDDELKPVPEALRHVYIPLDMKRQTSQGGTGQPTLATAEKGKALLEVVVRRGVETIKAMSTTKLT
jgi:creatinine amidohydrolase/Fe(II)-dependent formamide hydrolase-like protein